MFRRKGVGTTVIGVLMFVVGIVTTIGGVYGAYLLYQSVRSRKRAKNNIASGGVAAGESAPFNPNVVSINR